MFVNLVEHEACYDTKHGQVHVFSDYPAILSSGPSLTEEQVIAQAEADIKKMGDLSVSAFYGKQECEARKCLPKFYYAEWNRQRILKADHMPSKTEVDKALAGVL